MKITIEHNGILYNADDILNDKSFDIYHQKLKIKPEIIKLFKDETHILIREIEFLKTIEYQKKYGICSCGCCLSDPLVYDDEMEK